MTQINPNADDPFEVLRVDRSTPIHEIEEHASRLIDQHDDNDAVRAIGNAIDDIQSGPHVKQVGETNVEPLILKVGDNSVSVSEAVSVTVSDIIGSPVENAEIAVDGARKANTNSDGNATIKLSEPGDREIIATKNHPQDGYEYNKGKATVPVTKRERTLTFAKSPETITIDEEARLKIVDSSGDGVQNVTVHGPKISADTTTDTDGWVIVAPTKVGNDAKVIATKPDSKNRAYDDTQTSIDIVKREIHLAFTDPPSEVTYDSPTRFRVVDGEGNGVAGAKLSTPGETTTTDSDGYGTLQFDSVSLETVEIKASKNGTDSERYVPADTEVTVAPQHVELELQLVDNRAVAGETTTFTVVDNDGDAVERVFVTGEDGDTDTTDSSGEVKITFNDYGKKAVRASKVEQTGGYKYTTGKLGVSVEQQTERLRFVNLPDKVDSGETISLQVGTSNTNRLEGVKIQAEEGTDATTNQRGRAYLKFSGNGEKAIQASKISTSETNYLPVDDTITVVNRVDLEFESVPTDPTVDETFAVKVTSDADTSVSGVNIKIEGGTEATTDEHGRAYLKASETGAKQIEITKPADSKTRYKSNTTTVNVQKERRNLHFEELPDSVVASTYSEVRVADNTGDPVEGAIVKSNGEFKGKTGKQGRAVIKYDNPGPKTLRVTKADNRMADFESGSASIDIDRPAVTDAVDYTELVTALAAGGVMTVSAVLLLTNLPQTTLNPMYTAIQLAAMSIFISTSLPISYFKSTRESYLVGIFLTTAGVGTFGILSVLEGIRSGLFPYIVLAVVVTTLAFGGLRKTEDIGVAKLQELIQALGAILFAFILLFIPVTVIPSGDYILLLPTSAVAMGVIAPTILLR
jgi:hypothetical protein